MRNWCRKTRRRDKVEFILPGSTTADKKCRYVNVMTLAYILAPLSGRPKGLAPAYGRNKIGAGDQKAPPRPHQAAHRCREMPQADAITDVTAPQLS